MAEVINLRTARKRAARRDDDLRARINRAAHGRSIEERALEDARQSKASHELDRHRTEAGDGR